MVYAFAEKFLTAYGLTKTQIGVTMALANVASLLLQPAIAALIDRNNVFSLRVCLSAGAGVASLIALFELNPSNPAAVTAVLFGAMATVTLTLQPLSNAVGFHYLNRGEKLDFTAGRGIASGAYALASLAYGFLFDAFGAAVTLTDAFAALTAQWPQLHRFATRFAGLPVRNAGTLGGNVANGSPIGDSMPLLIALRAQVVLASTRGERTSRWTTSTPAIART